MWWTVLLLALPAAAVSPEEARSLVASDGVEQLQAVEALTFTFNVERNGELKASRTWTWNPSTNLVTRTVHGDTLTFTFGAPEGEAQTLADAQFVNDSFWLLPQLHLSWAPAEVRITAEGEVDLPIGDGKARKLTVQYPAEQGGYTPGDAYDLFLDDEGHIVAWHYRESGAEEPSLTTSFEAPQQVGPLRIATEHRSADGTFRLYFSDLSVRDSAAATSAAAAAGAAPPSTTATEASPPPGPE
jgi:hypothetical protein